MKTVLFVAGMLWTSALWASPAPDSGWRPLMAGQWLGGLVLVVAILLVCLWGLRKLNQYSSPAGGQIRLMGGLSLGNREKLLVVELGDTQLVLGIAPGRVQTLHVLEGERRLQSADKPSFTRQLQSALGEPRGKQ